MGLIREGSPPRDLTASLMAAKSTTAGTPLRERETERDRKSKGEMERQSLNIHNICTDVYTVYNTEVLSHKLCSFPRA